MIRIFLPLLLLSLMLAHCGPARAQAPGLDTVALSNVLAEAIDFTVPRALDAVTAARLTEWGLSGLTALDPGVTAATGDSTIALSIRGRRVLDVAPGGSDPVRWAGGAASIVEAAYAASPTLRRVGQAGVTKAVLDAMIARLDPYSRYIPPTEAVHDRVRRVGRAGVGLTLAWQGRSVEVRDVVMGSPGAQAGVVPGDIIRWVDGHAIEHLEHGELQDLLNGPEGTALRLDWLSTDGRIRGATMTRVMIPPETVFPRREGDIAIIQIIGFSQTTDQHVSEAVRDALRGARPITGIILDLRGNRGGLLQAAVATANLFLSPGVVVRTAGRAPETNRIWLSGNGEDAKNPRIVVLVDGGTASAAEIVAAALADRGRAVVMGSATFGKGVVQTIDPLPDGGELFLTWSRVLAPLGWPIQSLGVMPQVCLSLGVPATRRQLASLTDGRLEMDPALRAHRAARAPLTPDQIVAIREPCPAADPGTSDLAFARTLVDEPDSYARALLVPMNDER